MDFNLRVFAVIVSMSFVLTGCLQGSEESTSSNGTLADANDGDDSLPESEEAESTGEDEESQYFYFSYDDSSSTAARDLSVFALENGNKPSAGWGRPYEFLNAEEFEHFNKETLGPFDISFGAYIDQENSISLADADQTFSIGINLSGPVMTNAERPNVVLTLLVDVSGSMDSLYATETRSDIRTLLDVAKHGLKTLDGTLKEGDVINLVTFHTTASIVIEGMEYDFSGFVDTIEGLSTQGSTNLDAGIDLAYVVANRHYDPEKSNRVIILTDANANTGQTDPAVISQATVIGGSEGIYFAGIGMGSSFDDDFLNELTEEGKGVYSAMITPTDAERIFGEKGFIRFIDSAVDDVKFKLEYPSGLEHIVSSAEEVSENADEVQSIAFAYNDDQFFFEIFEITENYDDSKEMVFEISYTDADGESAVIRRSATLASLAGEGEPQIKAAAAVSTLAYLISQSDLECDEVLSSGLYQEETGTELFLAYKDYITDFCSL